MWSQVPQSPLRAKTAAALFWDLQGPVREKWWSSVSSPRNTLASTPASVQYEFSSNVEFLTQGKLTKCIADEPDPLCAARALPPVCQWQTEHPKHQINSSSQVFQCCKEMLLRWQQVRALHQHQYFSQWSYHGPSLGEEGGYRKDKKVVTGFLQWKEAPSESNSSNPS